jgi:hypothetical protein
LPAEAARTVVRRWVEPPSEDWSSPDDAKWLASRIADEGNPARRIDVSLRPRRWHEAIEPLRNKLDSLAKELVTSRKVYERYEKSPAWRKRAGMPQEAWEWSGYESGGQVMPITHKAAVVRLSLESYQRGIAILNALCWAARQRGFDASYAQDKGRILLTGHGGEVQIRMTEALEQKTRQVDGYGGGRETQRYKVPTGVLRLFVSYWPGAERQLSDRPDAPLEAQLNEWFKWVYRLVVKCRERTRQQEAQVRQEQEERVRQAEARRVEEEAEARREAEHRRRRELFEQAEAWRQAALIRRYVAARREKLDESEAVKAWAQWALKVAEDLDPVRRL